VGYAAGILVVANHLAGVVEPGDAIAVDIGCVGIDKM
jgi:hypothetical protein